jgi:hypothetical protein
MICVNCLVKYHITFTYVYQYFSTDRSNIKLHQILLSLLLVPSVVADEN